MNLTHKGNSPMDGEALIQAIANPGMAAKVSTIAMTAGGSGAVYFGLFSGAEISVYCAIGGFLGMLLFGTTTIIIRVKTYLLLKKDKQEQRELEGKGSN